MGTYSQGHMETCRHAGRHEHASICACTHISAHTCMYSLCTPVHVHTHTLQTNSTDTHMCAHTHLCTHTVCAYTLLRARTHTSVCTHTNVCEHTRMCMHVHTHITYRDAPPGGSRDYLKGWRQCPLPPPYPQSQIPCPPIPWPVSTSPVPQLQSTQPQVKRCGGHGWRMNRCPGETGRSELSVWVLVPPCSC